MSLLDTFLFDPYPLQVYIAYRKDGVGGSGTIEDPWDGSSAAKFDSILSTKVPATGNVTVNLGPAPAAEPFLTNGYYEVPGAVGGGGWQIRKGMRIVGSGIDVTVLKMASITPSSSRHYFAIGHDLSVGGVTGAAPNSVDYSQISDLTIDCGLPVTSDGVAAGALRVMGSNVSIRNVKAVNWGNRVANKIGFVIALINGNPESTPVASVSNSSIEDCIVINPSVPSGSLTVAEVLLLHSGGKDHDTTKLEAFGTAVAIRRCFVNAQDPSSPNSLGNGTDYRSKFRAISMASCVGGVVEGNNVMTCWFGGPCFLKWSARSIVVRDNSYRNVVAGPYANYGTGGIGAVISVTSLTSATTLAEATTSSAHNLLPGDRVLITNVAPAAYNGLFLVTTVVNSTKFQYQTVTAPAANGSGAPMRMQKVLGVEKWIAESNVIELATSVTSPAPVGLFCDAPAGALVAPAYMFGDVFMTNNHVRYLDGTWSSSLPGYGMDIKGFRNLQVDQNVIDVAASPSLKSGAGGVANYSENRTPAGVLVQGFSTVTNALFNELETDNDLALLNGFFSDKP